MNETLRQVIDRLTWQRRFGEALEHLDRIGSSETDAEIHRMRASVYYSMGNIERAIEETTKSLELNGNPLYNYYFRGLYRAEIGDFHGSVADLEMVNSLEEQRYPGEQFTSALFWIAVLKIIHKSEFDDELLNRIRADYEEYVFDSLVSKNDILAARKSESERVRFVDRLARGR
ncbi:MAG: tetratricopeptide repeat protein [Hyphomicrobiales bacterium]